MDSVRKNTSKLNELKTQITTLVRKTEGSLITRSLGDYVSKDDIVGKEYIASVLLVIPAQKEEEFTNDYYQIEQTPEAQRLKEREQRRLEEEEKRRQQREKEEREREKEMEEMDEDPDYEERKEDDKPTKKQPEREEKKSLMAPLLELDDRAPPIVVPSSAKKLHGEKEFVLYRVIVLTKFLDIFKAICREKRWYVRDFSFESSDTKADEQEKEKLEKQRDQLERRLRKLCEESYAIAFRAWLHLKMIRLFVESKLRYGPLVKFFIGCVTPKKAQDKKLRKALDSLYAHLAQMTQSKSKENEIDYSGLAADFYPYVYVPLRIEL